MLVKENLISDFTALLKIHLLPRYFMEIRAEEDYVRMIIPDQLDFSRMLNEIDAVAESCYSRIVFRNPSSDGSRLMIYVNNNRHSASLVYPKSLNQ